MDILLIISLPVTLLLLFLAVRRKMDKPLKYKVNPLPELDENTFQVYKKLLDYKGKTIVVDSFASYLCEAHCDYMIKNSSTSHDNYSNRAKILSNKGATYISEIVNIAKNLDVLWQEFLNSPKHKLAIDSNKYNTCGIAVKTIGEMHYAVLIFFKA